MRIWSCYEAHVMNNISLSSVQVVETLYADPPAPYLDSDVLSDEAKRAAEAFEVEGTSPNTRRTYRTALLYWGAWYALRYGRQLPAPVSVPAVIQFILDHLEHNPLEEPVEPSPFVPSSRTTQHLLPHATDRVLVSRAYKAKLGPWSLATVRTRLAALSRAHDVFIASQTPPLSADANPLRDPGVRQLLSMVQRAYARRPPEHERRPPAADRGDAPGDGSAPGNMPGRPAGYPGSRADAVRVCEWRETPVRDRVCDA
jgi:hypothetical protein